MDLKPHGPQTTTNVGAVYRLTPEEQADLESEDKEFILHSNFSQSITFDSLIYTAKKFQPMTMFWNYFRMCISCPYNYDR